MNGTTATAQAHPNIAFIKYWGNRDDRLRLPVNGSVSMNLGALRTTTTVTFDDSLRQDSLAINGAAEPKAAVGRVSSVLDEVRRIARIGARARVESSANFPAGVGVASSAAAFAALALAASTAAGLSLSEGEISRLARLGSGSACRSVPGGFCEWRMGTGDADSIAVSIADADRWDLVDLIAILSTTHKKVGSAAGHPGAVTSPYQAARIAGAPERIEGCREAIRTRDFARLAAISEEDSTLMHCVMMTQRPPLFYWEPASLAIMKAVPEWRLEGLRVFFTLDAGPTVHVLCLGEDANEAERRLRAVPGVADLLRSGAGGPARIVDAEF